MPETPVASLDSQWVTFKYAEIKKATANNSEFALLRVADNFTDYGRIDGKLFFLVEQQLKDLCEGNFTQLLCYPDTHKGPGNWRLDHVYYQTLYAETKRISLDSVTEKPEQTESPPEPDTVKVTVPLDVADHAFLSALHKQFYKTTNRCRTFESFNTNLMTMQLDLFRAANAELDNLHPKIPF